ncbi:MAG: DUF86 domain-containing protein [Niabella sp.]|nr:MAG: DUF86 domain-containing protein [Niabella sp.]
MKERDFKYIHDILEQINIVENFISGISKDQFMSDEKTQYAVVRGIELIGEISNKLSDEFIAEYKDFPYREMRGMRNRLIHEYDNVDIVKVYDVAYIHLPVLKKQVLNLINKI